VTKCHYVILILRDFYFGLPAFTRELNSYILGLITDTEYDTNCNDFLKIKCLLS